MMRASVSKSSLAPVAAAAMALAGLGLRLAGLPFESYDMTDWLLPWYDALAAGGYQALGEAFSNYTPPYLYLLLLATATQGLLPKIAAIKLVSILFDLGNALLVHRILKLKYPSGPAALLGAAGFLLLPTPLLNSAYWGQADSIYTFFLLGCLYWLLRNRPWPAFVFLGIAFAFKAQAVFLAPLLLLLTIRRRIPWLAYLVIPGVYFIMMLPAIVAGRGLLDVMTVYVSQAGEYGALSMHAPTLYVFAPESWHDLALALGLGLALLAAAAWVWHYSRNLKELTPEALLFCALVSVALVPFCLPKMHDRYFYLADVLSFLLAFYIPRLWYLAAGYQIVSLMAYSIFLLPSVMTIKRRTGDAILYGSAIVNTLLMALVLWRQWSEQRTRG
jgi:Gpi18-like mannosyltransferase